MPENARYSFPGFLRFIISKPVKGKTWGEGQNRKNSRRKTKFSKKKWDRCPNFYISENMGVHKISY